MKKLAVLLFGTLMFTGCGVSKEEKALECSTSKDMSKYGYTTESKYVVYAKDGYVTKVNSEEYVTSDSEDVLTTLEQTLSLTYMNYNMKYGGYDNKVSIEGNKLSSITNIDYDVVDLDQLSADTPSLKNYMEDGKLKVEGMKKLYEGLGATCK